MISTNRGPNENYLVDAELQRLREICSGQQWPKAMVSRNQIDRPLEVNMLPIRAHYRDQDQQRMAKVHQQADSEDWNGQVFRRVEDEE